MLSEPAASPARWIDVAPERFPGWIESFGSRHGVVRVAGEPGDPEPDGAAVFVAADRAVGGRGGGGAGDPGAGGCCAVGGGGRGGGAGPPPVPASARAGRSAGAR